MTERRRLIDPEQEVEQLRQAAAGLDQQLRIEARKSLAKMEMRLVWIGDHILRVARRIRHPFGAS